MIKDWITSQKTIAKSKKNYAHFDYRTDIVNLRDYVTDPEKVAHHGFYPFIHYKKKSLKFSKSKGRELKERDICYAAHVDRCIYQYYCHSMNQLYIKRIRELQIQDVPVAYRSDLGLNNIHLAKQAFDFINKNLESYVFIGDFTSFFDKLDHRYLKTQWCNLLGVDSLPLDYYAVFKSITKYSYWELNDLLRLNGLPETNAGRRELNNQPTVLTREQFKKHRSQIKKHKEAFGIPQGSPISALSANIYMIDVDRQIKSIVDQFNGKYMRYSDDFIIILPVAESIARTVIIAIIRIIKDTPGLELEPKKTQIYRSMIPNVANVGNLFFEETDQTKKQISFLGFTFDGRKIKLREKTIGKYYYRMRRKAHAIAHNPGKRGKDHLYEKYSERGAKTGKKNKGNFLTYVNRASIIIGDSEEIKRPVKRHMAKIRKALK